jgi:Na+-transporting methylmalonyl-CoA/oxaloacetate decarboxylase gamma subunit
MTWAALGIISVYTVPIVLLGMAVVFIVLALLSKKTKT